MSKRKKFVEGPLTGMNAALADAELAMTGLDRPADPKGTTRCASCETVIPDGDLCLDCDDWFSGELTAKTSIRWIPRIWREINDALGQCDRGPTRLGQPNPRSGLR